MAKLIAKRHKNQKNIESKKVEEAIAQEKKQIVDEEKEAELLEQEISYAENIAFNL